MWPFLRLIYCIYKWEIKMRKIKTLKKNHEFKNVLSRGKFYSGNQITIYITKNKKSCNVIGIAISTKICNAVKRNRIKRLIRENYILLKNRLETGNNIVFLWNKKADVEKVQFNIIKQDMEKLFCKAGVLKNE